MKSENLKKKTGAILVASIVATSVILPTGVALAANNNQRMDQRQGTSQVGQRMEQNNMGGNQNSNNQNTPPEMSGETQSSSNSNVSHTGASKISSDITTNSQSYSSTTEGENALLVTGGNSTIKNATINKTGSSSDENSDFYGTNAGVLVTEGTLNIEGGTVTTDGGHANGVFSYGNGTINIKDVTIHTKSNNSWAVMVTGGGTLNATNVTATTEGNSSAPIRSDRGGGTLNVTGGKYTSNGVGSPVIYSTADVTVSDATLVSTKSEGAVVEGKNSITLNNVDLTDTNTTLNGQSTTYKNIFLYQSMSGDAETGTAKFTANGSKITTNKGDTIYVTNTTAVIELINNTIINNDNGALLRAEAGPWGTSEKNGGNVTLKLSNQNATGDVLIDNISTLSMALRDGSYYEGTINGENSAKSIELSLSSNSKIKLTGNSYVSSLSDEDETLSNIDFNGYTLYVNGTAVNESSKANVSLSNYEEEVTTQEDNSTTEQNANNGERPQMPGENNSSEERPELPNQEMQEGQKPELPNGENNQDRPELPNGDMQQNKKTERPNGMEMRDGSFVPDEDDDGTKYPKPDSESQMQEGERPEMPSGENNQNKSEKPNKEMNNKERTEISNEGIQEGDKTKLPNAENKQNKSEISNQEMNNQERQEETNNQRTQEMTTQEDKNFFQMLQQLPQDFINWLRTFFGGNR